MRAIPSVHPPRNSGFTLVELLIALALMGILVTSVVYVNIGTSRSAALLQARNDLLPESQQAQTYIASKLRQASYVFPDGTTLTLDSASKTTQRPVDDGSSWTVGTDPVLAFIVPPKTVTPGACAAATTTDAKDKACYAFYAFYGLKRSTLTANTTGIENPGADVGNDNSVWALMEFRNFYATGAAGGYATPAAAVAAIPSGGVGHLVLDYLKPPSGTEVLFDSPAATVGIAQAAGTTNVVMNLAVTRSVAGQTLSLPASGRYSLTIYPRNLGAQQVAN